MNILRAIWKRFLDVCFPKGPEVAGLEDAAAVGLRDALPKAARPTHTEDVLALFDYGNDRVRALVWEIKYRNNPLLAEAVAELMAEELLEEVSRIETFETGQGGLHPLIIPVPLSAERRRERGWNQSEVLAELVWRKGLSSSTLYVPNLLAKVRHTESQTALGREERLRNLVGAFTVTNPAVLRDRHVILVDDVITTGATITEARRTLIEAGAKKVVAYTIAH